MPRCFISRSCNNLENFQFRRQLYGQELGVAVEVPVTTPAAHNLVVDVNTNAALSPFSSHCGPWEATGGGLNNWVSLPCGRPGLSSRFLTVCWPSHGSNR